MEQPKKRRTRIKQKVEEIEVVDPLEFQPNCASKNAKLIHKYKEFEVELWIDKHYESRLHHGDELGKREGIEKDLVKNLIVKSFKYLLDIFLRHPNFKFITYFEYGKATSGKRILLKDFKKDGTLNVVIEIHYLNTSRYEVTVVTAMQVDNFKKADGQYILSFSEVYNNVTLKRYVNKSDEIIYSLKL